MLSLDAMFEQIEIEKENTWQSIAKERIEKNERTKQLELGFECDHLQHR